jgi:hypothetical protein
LLSKLLASFKNEKPKVEKKVKPPKSPKKEKKKEEEVEVLLSLILFYQSHRFHRLLLLRSLPRKRPLRFPQRPSRLRNLPSL